MNTAVINIRVNSTVKKQAQKTVEKMGLSLSDVINGFLRHLIKTKTVTFTAREEPSAWFIKALKESREDIKAGRVTSFESIDDARAYVDKLIAEDETKANKRRLFK